MNRWVLRTVVAVSIGLLAGCALPERSFPVEVATLVEVPPTMGITVHDRTGYITGVEPHLNEDGAYDLFLDPEAQPADVVAGTPPGDQNVLLVFWLFDGFCDRSADVRLSVDGDRLRIDVAVKTGEGAPDQLAVCGQTATPVGVTIRLSQPVPDRIVSTFARAPAVVRPAS